MIICISIAKARKEHNISYLPSILHCRTKLPSTEHDSCIVYGRKYTGDEALKAGIVHRTADNTLLMDTALELAEEISQFGNEEHNNQTVSEFKKDLYPDLYRALDQHNPSKL